MEALIWIDDGGGVVWVRRYQGWVLRQSFSWDELNDVPLSLLKQARVSILSALSAERLIIEPLPRLKLWERRSMITRRLMTHFPDSPYNAGLIQGRLNALQSRFASLALPRELLDNLLTQLHLSQAVCREIIPVAHLFTRWAQKKRMGIVLWVILYRHMHCYFVDEMGLRVCRTLALPKDSQHLYGEVKKIYRYLMGQKYLSVSEHLIVRCWVVNPEYVIEDLPMTEQMTWHTEKTPFPISVVWQRCRGEMNCAPLYLRQAYAWRYWNRLAWYGAGMMICGIAGVGISAGYYYLARHQQLQKIQARTASISDQKVGLGKTAKLLLGVEAYRQKYTHVNYEETLYRLSHILADFPLWSLDSVEWQSHPSHKLILIGKWQRIEEGESMNARFERTLMRQLQAKQIRLSFLNQERGQMQVDVHFDRLEEDG